MPGYAEADQLKKNTGPPGPFYDDGQPDMRYRRNQTWFEHRGVFKGDPEWGTISLKKPVDPYDSYLDERSITPEPAPEPEPEPEPRFCRPIVSFGFGGQLVVMFPRNLRSRTNNNSDNADTGDCGISPVPGSASADSSPAQAHTSIEHRSCEREIDSDDLDDDQVSDSPSGLDATGGITPDPDVGMDGDCGTVCIYEIGRLLEQQPEYRGVLKPFPGPLGLPVAGTSRRAVEEFAVSAANAEPAPSTATLWRLLGGICRQGGRVRSAATSRNGGDPDDVAAHIANALVEGVPAYAEDSKHSGADTTHPQHLSHDAVLAEMQPLIREGRLTEACAMAVRHSIWDHAMLLSLQISADAHANVRPSPHLVP